MSLRFLLLFWLVVWVPLSDWCPNTEAADLGKGNLFLGQIGSGFESNVFQNESKARGDFFLFTEGLGHITWKPSRNDTLFLDLVGSYQSFQRLKNANQFYVDGAADFQHRFTPFLDLGLSQLLSYNDLKLLDTEGEPLPRTKIGSLNSQTRLYGIYRIDDDWDLEVGGGYRRKDAQETSGFPSLDLNVFFVDAALRYYWTQASLLRIKYAGSYVDYNELTAGSAQTGIPDPNNPRLVLRRHEVQLKALLREFSKIQLEGFGKFRYNEDDFENNQTYIQYEGGGRLEAHLFWDLLLNSAATLRTRDFRVRASNVFIDPSSGQFLVSPEMLEEHFFIVEASLVRNLLSYLELSLRYQWVKRNTNALGGDFENSLGMIGLRVRL